MFKFPPMLLANPETSEVIETFNRLYYVTDPAKLPSRAVLMPYTDDAHYVDLKGGIPQWADVEILPGQNQTYGEIFMEEVWSINDRVNTVTQAEIVDGVPPIAVEAAADCLPERMWIYAPWIFSDFVLILEKRLAFGKASSLIEDLFSTYAAGYFSFGWSGSFPDDVRFLVFAGSEAVGG